MYFVRIIDWFAIFGKQTANRYIPDRQFYLEAQIERNSRRCAAGSEQRYSLQPDEWMEI